MELTADAILIGDPTVSIGNGQENSNRMLARIIMDGRRKLSTRKNYVKKISIFQSWIAENYDSHTDKSNGSIVLPLPPTIISEFMAKISVVTDKRTNLTRSAAVSQVGSYRSALAWLYEKEHLKFNTKPR